MKNWANNFASVFFIGFIAITLAFGYGAMTGDMLSTNNFLVMLRYFSYAFMAGGLALWVALRRKEAGNEGLNPLLGLLVGAGLLSSTVGLLFPNLEFSTTLGIVGVGLSGGAALIGFIAMILNPAFPQPIVKSWEDGLESPLTSDYHEEHSGGDDLTRIEGIGQKLSGILIDAGIQAFNDLASRSPDELTTLIKDAGFGAPFNPETWPQQAELAAAGKWDALDKFQDELIGGRSVE